MQRFTVEPLELRILLAADGPFRGRPVADMDTDGMVGFSDFLILSSNYDQSVATTAAVPEPSTLALSLAGLIGSLLSRRRPNTLIHPVVRRLNETSRL